MSDDLILRLRQLARHAHDDLSVAGEAANEIERLRADLRTVQAAARSGMDAAKAHSSVQLAEATRMRAESNPDALASERSANSILTEETERLRTALAALRARSDGAPVACVQAPSITEPIQLRDADPMTLRLHHKRIALVVLDEQENPA